MSNTPANPADPILPSDFVRIEAAALTDLALRLDGPMLAPFTQAVNLLLRSAITQNRIIVTGIGKSGIIARKIAATLRSTGTPAHYLHPADAIHGDLGMLSRGDTVLALSASGETEELLRLLPLLKRLADKLITLSAASPPPSPRPATSSSTPASPPKPAPSTSPPPPPPLSCSPSVTPSPSK